MQPCKSSPKYLPKRNENMPIQMYVHVYGSFIHNHHLKTAQMLTAELWYVCTMNTTQQ